MPAETSAIQYLRQFGYLRHPPAMEGVDQGLEENDDALRAAILEFQNMAQLPATGELDAATLAKMRIPRCGVPDFGYGFSDTMSAGFGFVLEGRTWDHAIITYRVENTSTDMDGGRQRDIIRTAFARWAAVIPLVFREVGGDADIRVRFATGDHGDGQPFDGRGGVLAHAFFPPPNSGALAGDVHFDEDENWQEGVAQGGIDLLAVAVHELGHSLGLRHTSVPNSTMNPFYPTPATPQNDDRDGARSAYREHVWIASMYRDLLRRRFDEAGFDGWVRNRSRGMSPYDIARCFTFSAEHSNMLATELYRTLLDRAPDPGGLAGWARSLEHGMSRQSAMIGFLSSREYLNNNPVPGQFVDSLYRRLLLRAPDPGGYASWVNFMNGGGSPTQVADGFLRSDEFTRNYATSLYRTYLRREPEPEGLAHWSGRLKSGLSHQDGIASFIASNEYRDSVLRWW